MLSTSLPTIFVTDTMIKNFILLFVLVLLGFATYAQERQPSVANPKSASKSKPIVQFTGLVVSGENAFGVPGVTIFIPKTRRGTVTNNVGYFSIPVLEGDTTVISATGYKRQRYVVPAGNDASHSVIFYLQADTLVMPSVEVTPYGTEELFKKAFLALDMTNRDVISARNNLDPFLMENMKEDMGMTATENARFYTNQEIKKLDRRYQAPTLSLTDPFAWAQFIQSVKRGDLKKKK